jgi:hypothetical protein
MTILTFVTQDELDNLSEDPKVAFMQLVNHAQRRLSERIAGLDLNEQSDWNKKTDAEKSFMNVIVASGKRLEVEPFSTMVIPRNEQFQNSDYEQFKSDLEHYITQLVLDNSIRAKKLSVEILPASKDKIRAYVSKLRESIEQGNMSPNKKRALLDRLSEFERELDKRRTGFVALAVLAITFVGAPGAAAESVDVTNRLVTKITEIFAESKRKEDAARQIGQEPQKALSPPRPQEKEDTRPSWESSQSDDDIPF